MLMTAEKQLELERCCGQNPKPADFDDFWRNSLNEAAQVNINAEMVPAEFCSPAADCYELYFTGTYDTRIHVRLLLPKNAKNNGCKYPAVLHFHGLSGACDDWLEYLGFAASGIAVAAMDVRGQGGLSDDGCRVSLNTYHGFVSRGLMDSPEKMYFRNVYLDTVLLAQIIMKLEYIDESRIGVYGVSQGGGLALVCAALVPQIKRAAPCYPFLCDFQRVMAMGMGGAAYEDLTTFFRFHDLQHKREQEIFTKLGYIDVQHFAERIRAEVLMFTGLADTTCPPEAQMAAYNKITSKKRLILLPDYGHEPIPGRLDMVYSFMLGL